MKAGGVALILRLETARELVGFLLLGEKQDDSFYNSKDTTMLSTVGYELGLAVQNGLRFQEIQAFNATLQEKVEEATYQLRQSNRKLQALDQAKDEFISMASHQLRTPLTSVKGYLSMVIDGDAGSLKDDQAKLLGEAYASAERMVYLISDFLNISRIRTGKFVLESKPVNLASIISSEIGQLGISARNRKLQLVYDPPANFPIGVLDEEKLRQVIMNFIDNAIYYTPAGGKITVTLTATAKDIIFRVTDTGIGVPPSERHKLFTKFYRATNAKHIRPDGTGIGLFMAKKVITMHGGSIIFETSESKGSTFGFSVPLHHPTSKK
jgi:signal transduction histidine kinase